MLSSLQILRGFSAWLVVFYHIQVWYLMGDTERVWWSFLEKVGGFGIDIFFVISGVVMGLIAKNYQDKEVDFLINRIFRVMPPYWFYTILLVVSILVFPAGTYSTSWNVLSLFKSLLLIPNSNPGGMGDYPTLFVGWTLIYEMFFYIVFFIVLFLKVPRASISCALVLLCIAFVFRSNNFLGYSSYLLLEFSIGILICEYFNLIKGKLSLISKMYPIFIFLTLFIAVELIDNGVPSKIFMAGLIVYLFMVMEPLLSMEGQPFRLLKNLGDYSYSTYLLHIIVIGWFNYLFRNIDSGILLSLDVIGILITVLIASRYSYLMLERNKYLLKLKHQTIKLLSTHS